MRRFFPVCFVLFVLAPSVLYAQDSPAAKRKFGLTFPNTGIIWHITDNVAFLPGFSFNHNWGSSDDFYKNTSNSLNVDASLRFYLREWKGVRFYLAPKYTFGWSDVETEYDFGTGLSTAASTAYSHSVSGAWGLQYAISDRISLWGDIGIRYNHGTSGSAVPLSMTDLSSNSVSTVGNWGLILYLK
jgi:hypothetical protein